MDRHNIFAATTVAFRGAQRRHAKPFIERELRAWLAAMKIKTLYSEPGSPWQNGYIESFHARFREECLNREQLWTLTEARVVIEDWRWLYNHVHPSLDFLYQLNFNINLSRLTPLVDQFA